MFCTQCGAANPDDGSFCAACGKRLTRSAPSPAHVSPLDLAPTEVGLVSGTVLANRYRIVKLLGVGGMGRVYLAEDRTLDDEPVAVKVLRDVLSHDVGSVRRLKEEAKLARRQTHPNIVRVHTFEDGELVKFLVMEFVEGETLAERIGRVGRVSEEEARRVGIALCDALAYAHGQNLVHRDVKPANVLLGKDGAIRLADFGIARAARESLSRLTGQFVSGTLIYAAPEQVRGKPGDARADLYGLGVVLYEMVAGEPPFHRGDVTHQVLNESPEPLVGVSQEFALLVAGLLEKEPGARPEGTAVRAVLDGSAARRSEEERRRLEEEERRQREQEAQRRAAEEEVRRRAEAEARQRTEEERRLAEETKRREEQEIRDQESEERRIRDEEQAIRAAAETQAYNDVYNAAKEMAPLLVMVVAILLSILFSQSC